MRCQITNAQDLNLLLVKQFELCRVKVGEITML